LGNHRTYGSREQEPSGDDFAALVAQLPDLFNNITEFVTTALATRGYYDNGANWVEQTYKAVRKLRSASSIAVTPPTTTTSNKPTWARIASHLPPPTQDEATLRQVKVRVTDPADRKTVWTTANAAILQRVVKKTENAGVVGIKKLPSGDLVIQLKEQMEEVLARRSAWLEQVTPSEKSLLICIPCLFTGSGSAMLKLQTRLQLLRS
jgi:hypothetical protein